MIFIVGIIGVGLFVGSGFVINVIGLVVVVLYVVVGLLVVLLMCMFGEMVMVNSDKGLFVIYV